MMPEDYRARKRLEGFETGLAAAGLTLADREFYSGGSALLKGREMTAAILGRTPDLDFLYYSNDMIGAGGLLYCLHEQIAVPERVGLAGFNGVDLLDGLPRRLATMDACRSRSGGLRPRSSRASARGHCRAFAHASAGRHHPPGLTPGLRPQAPARPRP